ncbi:MAG: flavin reductase [Myxococcota bacterium]|nr:flavin reductase [Myxococcota bacterium]
MNSYGKKEISSSRYDWQPTPLPEQVVLVTTVDAEGRAHVATKSRIAVISYGPPTLLVFACRADYPTAVNLKAVGEFVVNIPGDDLVATSWVIGSNPSSHGPQLFAENGLSPIPSHKVHVPRIAECHAHLECEIDHKLDIEGDLIVFGRVVSASMDESIIQASKDSVASSYQRLAPFFFLDGNLTSSLGPPRMVDEPVPGPRHDLTVLHVNDVEESVDFYSRGFDWPIQLKKKGYVVFQLPDSQRLAIRQQATNSGGTERASTATTRDSACPVELHFLCDNLPRTLARLISAGAQVLSELKIREDGEETAHFADPDGNILIIGHRATPKHPA